MQLVRSYREIFELNDELLDKVFGGVQDNELNLKAQLKLYIGLCPFGNRPSIEIFGTVHKNTRCYNRSAYIELS